MEISLVVSSLIILCCIVAVTFFKIGFKMGTENGYWRGRLDELLDKGGPNG